MANRYRRIKCGTPITKSSDFPTDAGVGTAPQGRFTIDPTKTPKQVDSTALAGPHKGQVTYGIYEILDASNKRACWSMPGAPRPTDFTSTPGSGRTVQYWRLISKEPGDGKQMLFPNRFSMTGGQAIRGLHCLQV